MTHPQHPSESQLMRFAKADLPEPEFERIAAHLENCDRCADVLCAAEESQGGKQGAHENRLTQSASCRLRPARDSDDSGAPNLLKQIGLGDVGRRPLTESHADVFNNALAALSDVSGSLVGPYKLLRKLGESGMGTVYVAEQEVPVRRMVALKIIKPGMDSSQVLARFDAERQALAMMDHNTIARVLDAGATDKGRFYFVMELVTGEPITEYCDQYRLTPRERLALFVSVCQAVQHAHQKGIIHRDIKPSNVLVTRCDGQPVPKVIDFGVAKATQQQLTERTMFTQFGQIIGTLEYMSPEQAGMNQLDIDTRSDVYSLGALLYELLTGSTPITREQLRAVGFDEMFRTIRDAEPPKPSTRLSESGKSLPSVSAVRGTDPAKLSKLVRGDLDWIVMKALEKDRTRRYETANSLAADIQRFLENELVQARPPSATYRLRKFAHRNAGLLATVGTIAVVLLLGTLMSTWQAIRASVAEKQARDNEVRATEARIQAEGDRRKAQKLADQNKRLAVREKAARLDTERELRIATAMRLAAQSQSIRQKLPVQSLLLAVEAVDATRRHEEPVVPIAHESLRSALSFVGGLPLSGHERPLAAVAFSSDGHWLVTAGGDNTARLWDLTFRHPWTRARPPAPILLRGHEDSVVTAAFSADARWLVTGSQDGNAQLWDLEQPSFDKAFPLTGHEAPVTTVAFSPGSRWLATKSRDNSVRLWDLTVVDPTTTGDVLAGVAPSPTVEVIVTADGPWLVTPKHVSQYRGGVRLWDLNKAHAGARVLTNKYVSEAVISWNRRWLITASGVPFSEVSEQRPAVLIWDLTAKDPAGAVKVLHGHDVGFSAIAISRDERWLATADVKTARLWDLAAEDPESTLRVLRGHEGEISETAMSPDDHWLVTVSTDKTVRLWDLTAKDPAASARILRGHEGAIYAIAISPDGHWLVTGSADNTARVWDLTSGEPEASVRVLRGHEGSVNLMSVSPDGHWLATGLRKDPVPRLWDLTAEYPGSVDIVLRASVSVIGGLSDSRLFISPDGRWLAVRGSPSRLWDLTVEDPSRTTRDLNGQEEEGHAPRILGPWDHDEPVAISTRWLVTTRRDRSPRLWDLKAQNPEATHRDLDGATLPVEISPDEHWLVTGSPDATLRLWNLNVEDPLASEEVLLAHRGIVRPWHHRSVAFSPDGHWLATCSTDTAMLWNLTKHDPSDAPKFLPGEGHISDVGFSPNRISDVGFSPNGRWLLKRNVIGRESKLLLWDMKDKDAVATPTVLRADEEAHSSIFQFAFAPDSHWLVTRTYPTTTAVFEGGRQITTPLTPIVELWDLSGEDPTATPISPISHLADRVIAFSGDGHWLVTSAGGIAMLWDLTAEDPVATARPLHGHAVHDSASFSPDSRWLATAGLDGTTRLWDLARPLTAPAAAVLRGHENSVRVVQFTPDGRWLVTASDDGTTRLWDMSIDRLVETALRQAGRELTDVEASQYYLPDDSPAIRSDD